MQCVRCLKDTAAKIAEAPDGSHAWDLYFCDCCHYSWRSDEPDYITDPAKRDRWAQMADDPNFEGVIYLVESDYKPKRGYSKK